MDQIQHIVLVLSGKGGVGKSTTSAQLAITLSELGYSVGLLDIDLTGPSIPRIFGLEDHSIQQTSQGWEPVFHPDQKIKIISLGFLLPNKNDAVIWRGPKKTSMIKQFVHNVAWGPLDYLVIDTPPGTSDEHISICEYLTGFNPTAVLVTTPQSISLSDVSKEINFCKTAGIPTIGIIENMSGYVCPHCAECSYLFSKDGGKALGEEYGVPLLAQIPIDPKLSMAMDQNEAALDKFKASLNYPLFVSVAKRVIDFFNT